MRRKRLAALMAAILGTTLVAAVFSGSPAQAADPGITFVHLYSNRIVVDVTCPLGQHEIDVYDTTPDGPSVHLGQYFVRCAGDGIPQRETVALDYDGPNSNLTVGQFYDIAVIVGQGELDPPIYGLFPRTVETDQGPEQVPQETSYKLDQEFVFTHDAPIARSGKVFISEPAGWTFQKAFLGDCTYDGSSNAEIPGCDVWLRDTANKYSAKTHVRTIDIGGAVPNVRADGFLNREPDMSETLHVTYLDPDGNSRSFDVGPMIFMSSGTRATLHASTSVKYGKPLHFQALLESFSRSWVPLQFHTFLQFRAKGSKTWSDVDEANTNGSGIVDYTVPVMTTTGDWRVITRPDDTIYVQALSNAVTVKVK